MFGFSKKKEDTKDVGIINLKLNNNHKKEDKLDKGSFFEDIKEEKKVVLNSTSTPVKKSVTTTKEIKEVAYNIEKKVEDDVKEIEIKEIETESDTKITGNLLEDATNFFRNNFLVEKDSNNDIHDIIEEDYTDDKNAEVDAFNTFTDNISNKNNKKKKKKSTLLSKIKKKANKWFVPNKKKNKDELFNVGIKDRNGNNEIVNLSDKDDSVDVEKITKDVKKKQPIIVFGIDVGNFFNKRMLLTLWTDKIEPGIGKLLGLVSLILIFLIIGPFIETYKNINILNGLNSQGETIQGVKATIDKNIDKLNNITEINTENYIELKDLIYNYNRQLAAYIKEKEKRGIKVKMPIQFGSVEMGKKDKDSLTFELLFVQNSDILPILKILRYGKTFLKINTLKLEYVGLDDYNYSYYKMTISGSKKMINLNLEDKKKDVKTKK